MLFHMGGDPVHEFLAGFGRSRASFMILGSLPGSAPDANDFDGRTQ
jgi:hypothetical protein